MQVDFSAPILDLLGNGLPAKGGKVLTLGEVACEVLQAQFQDEANLSAQEKYKRYGLALKLAPGGEVDLTIEEAELLKRLIGKGCSALVMGRSFDMFEAAAKPPAKDADA